MQDAACSRHPLDIARADHPAPAGGIPVFDLALIDDGDRLEAAVRMNTDPTGFSRRREVGRSGIVQQQEWTDMIAVRCMGKQGAHRKAVADPVCVRTAVDSKNLSHRISPIRLPCGASPL